MRNVDQIFIAINDTVCIFYFEMHLKYCQDTDVYW